MRRGTRMSKSRGSLILKLLVLLCTSVGETSSQSMTPAQRHATNSEAKSCSDAAKKALGFEGEVVRCGYLTGADTLEAVAVLRLEQFRDRGDSIAVSKLVILRQNSPEWNVELTADRGWIRNSAGYVGIEFIDDSEQIFGYRASFSDRRSDDVAAYTIYLNFLSPTGHNEGTAIEISWNPSVARFQEFAYGEDPEGFKPEIKNPPHIRTRNPPH